ncbi:hypothetical protein ACHAPI_011073 [Fusarium lateritium]
MATITSALGRFLEDWCDPDSEARFGHIQIPPYRIEGLLETMRQHFQTANSHMPFFVVPDGELEIGTGLNCENEEFPSELMSFSKLMSVIRHNRYPGIGEKWRVGYGVEEWEADEILPRKSIFVLQLDPAVSADCALALIDLVNWALSANDIDGNRVQLLTISAEKDSGFLSKLISVAAPRNRVYDLDLAVHGEQDPEKGAIVFSTTGTAEKAANILASIRNGPEIPRVIVTFDEGLFDEVWNGLRQSEYDLVDAKFCINGDVSSLTNLKIGEGADGQTLLILVDSELHILPLGLPSCDELHLALYDGYIPGQPLWDDATAQVTMCPRSTSGDDRRLQLWWARQPSIKKRHIYATGKGIPAFLEDSCVRERLVEISQLGGFIAAAMDMSSWGVDAEKAIACFVRYSLRIEEMYRRLTIQRVITSKGPPIEEDELEKPRPALFLSEVEANVFRNVLSLLDYDHRLALLVALEANPVARILKVEIAAILKFGSGNLVELRATDDKEYEKKLDQMLKGCHDVSGALCSTGSIWFTLGHFRRVRSGGDALNDLSNLVYVKESFVAKVHTLTEDIKGVLEKAGAKSSPSISINQEDERQVQRDLARAYIYQLTWSRYPAPSKRIVHKFLSTMTTCTLAREPKGASYIIDFHALVSENGGALGICHDVHSSRTNNEISSDDWTWIPSQVVADWLKANEPDRHICEVLSTGIQHH